MSQALVAVFLAIVLVILAAAWRSGLPLWTASWYGYGGVAIIFGLSTLNRWAGLIENKTFNNFLILGGLILFCTGILWLYRRDPRRGLLAALFLLPVIASTSMEFIPDFNEGLILLASAGLAGLVAAGTVLIPDWRTGLGLALVSNLFCGLMIAYASEYWIEVPVPHIPRLELVVLSLAMYLALSLGLFAGPLLFWRLWDARKLSSSV